MTRFRHRKVVSGAGRDVGDRVLIGLRILPRREFWDDLVFLGDRGERDLTISWRVYDNNLDSLGPARGRDHPWEC